MATPRRLAVTLATTLALFGGVACSSGSDEPAKPGTAATSDADSKDRGEDGSGESSSEEVGSGGDTDATTDGSIVVEIGGRTWELDQVTCGFGEEETGVEGAELNLAAGDGSVSLYVAVEPDRTYIEFGEPESVDGGTSYTTLGVGSPDPDIQIDGRSINATVAFYDQSDFGADPVEGSVAGTCP